MYKLCGDHNMSSLPNQRALFGSPSSKDVIWSGLKKCCLRVQLKKALSGSPVEEAVILRDDVFFFRFNLLFFFPYLKK